jgi:site-specific DNA-methyltransferase (adenine-specific)
MSAVVMVGDCRELMAGLADESVDAIVTDPPYELGFMGKSWDASGIAYDLEVWRQALRVLKPGGHLLAFSGSRTYHRMVCAIEDAGFEIRDQIMWLYGSGFPKSHDVSKAIDREAGAERRVVGRKENWWIPGRRENAGMGTHEWHRPFHDEPEACERSRAITAPATPEAARWHGWGTALKPAHEPIVVARKPFKGTVAQNVLAHGTGALNIDGCRVGTDGDNSGRWPANVIHDGSEEVLRLFPETGPSKAAARGGSNPNPMDWGNSRSDGSIVKGHDDAGGSAARFFYCPKASKRDREEGLDGFRVASPGELTGGRKEGSAGLDSPRAGAGRTSGRSNHHPTVKPTDLMRYLCRLVTPPGGIVLDPFTGSGSTGKAAVLEGFRFIGCELSEEYAAIARARIAAAQGPGARSQGPDTP